MAQITEQQKVLLGVAIVFVLFLLGSFIDQHYFSHPSLKPRQCNASHSRCTVTIGNLGDISLSVAPKTITAGTPINFTVQINGLRVQQVSLDIVSDTTPTCATQQTMSTQDGHSYSTRLSVPVCAKQANRWLFIVRAGVGQTAYVVPFHMTANGLA